jgi:hypothetical protein
MGTKASPRVRRREPSGRQRARFGDLLAGRVRREVSQNARRQRTAEVPSNAG